MLKTVRTPSSRRTGPAKRIAGWNAGANMKPMPTSSMHRFTEAGLSSSFTPFASSMSALPTVLEAARLPCFATFTPQAAVTTAAAVEMLNVPIPSPPVPTTSTTSPPVSTCSAFSRMTSAMPLISSTVSPFMRSATRNAAICAGVAPPVMISSAAAAASSRPRDVPTTSFWTAFCTISAASRS